MKIQKIFFSKLNGIKNWFLKLSLIKKIIIIVIFLGIGWFGFSKTTSVKGQVQYQTDAAQKGTLVVTVTGSGQVSTANNGTITTQATGVVSKLYVKDGDMVKTGDKIAEIDLDLPGQLNTSQALSSYQTANNNLESAKAGIYTFQSDMFTQWKKYYDLATNSTYQNSDGSPNDNNRTLSDFHVAQDNWLASEAKYKNQQNVVAQTQTAYNSAWLSYQQSSPTIYAPISGKISGLSLQPGSVISATQSNNSQNSTQSSTKIANVKTEALPTISINLTEIDVPKVKTGDHATIKFDAFPDKTFTGKVVSIDTAGIVSSGVTTYPTVIRLDTQSNNILSNMAVTASIITATKDNALLVPAGAVQSQNGESIVRILKNDQPQQVTVETGLSSDTQVEILSGLAEGDTVITGTSSTSTGANRSNQTQSPFGGFGGGRGGFGGGAVRMGR